MVGAMALEARIEELFARSTDQLGKEFFESFDELKEALNLGLVRAAEPTPAGWKVNTWVKKGILLGFRIGQLVEMPLAGCTFRDKHTYPLRQTPLERTVRIVPGGSSLRDGCYVGKYVTIMPPAYINVGAYVDDDTMVDSHALVGSCAQVGKRVHLSAGAQVGGVLEPVGRLPVIIEDDVLVGGNSGIYEGTIVRRSAILAAGTILTGSTPVYDLVHGRVHRRQAGQSLVIPPGAVVVPGARAATLGRGPDWGLSLYTPVIIKYRDQKTDVSVQLEELLR